MRPEPIFILWGRGPGAPATRAPRTEPQAAAASSASMDAFQTDAVKRITGRVDKPFRDMILSFQEAQSLVGRFITVASELDKEIVLVGLPITEGFERGHRPAIEVAIKEDLEIDLKTVNRKLSHEFELAFYREASSPPTRRYKATIIDHRLSEQVWPFFFECVLDAQRCAIRNRTQSEIGETKMGRQQPTEIVDPECRKFYTSPLGEPVLERKIPTINQVTHSCTLLD